MKVLSVADHEVVQGATVGGCLDEIPYCLDVRYLCVIAGQQQIDSIEGHWCKETFADIVYQLPSYGSYLWKLNPNGV
jgi:hypothetical protein